MKKKEKEITFLNKKINRRDFIKYGLTGLAGLSLGGYFLNKYFLQKAKGVVSQDAPTELWKWSKESFYYTKKGESVQCLLCPNKCLLAPGQRSFCRTRINHNGKLYALSYGNPCAVHIDPIEKKPLYHFLPATSIFSIATAGCNFRCLNCQNWTISQQRPEDTNNYDLFPDQVVSEAIRYNTKSIAYTYSGPIAFYEYMYDTAKLAHKHGLRNVWVTQGYMNEKPLRDLAQHLDAANVDLKHFTEELYSEICSGDLQTVLNTLKTLKDENTWFEITNLVIPTINDDMDMIKEMCEWIVKNLGKDYPLHFSRFVPHYKLTHLPYTPVKTLEQARNIALETGIKFVYIGNVPGHEATNTYCPSCSKVLIERKGYTIIQNNIVDGKCKFCNEPIAGVFT
ncbi:AmmeMemoRadiSam system radical SAM enzyme [Candidatus Woesearchaeota archaeon]|nr:AmmeMemoRadiSam system radical SAM enzyme [Candidatus Woesearchaeota archaeon]